MENENVNTYTVTVTIQTETDASCLLDSIQEWADEHNEGEEDLVVDTASVTYVA